MNPDDNIYVERARVAKAQIIAHWLVENGVTAEVALDYSVPQRFEAGRLAGKPKPSAKTWAQVIWQLVIAEKPPAPAQSEHQITGMRTPPPEPKARPPYEEYHRVLVALDCEHHFHVNPRSTGLTIGRMICPTCKTYRTIHERTP